MTGLAAEKASQFFRSDAYISAQHTTVTSGIQALVPDACERWLGVGRGGGASSEAAGGCAAAAARQRSRQRRKSRAGRSALSSTPPGVPCHLLASHPKLPLSVFFWWCARSH